MRVTYRGPHTDGVVTEWGLAVPGESIEVPDGTDLGGDFETDAPATSRPTSEATSRPTRRAKPAKKKESD